MAIDRSLQYVCKRCQTVRRAKIVTIFPNAAIGDDKTKKDIEVIKSFKRTIEVEGKSVTSEFIGRQLECNHFIDVSEIPFLEPTNESLSVDEATLVREAIQKEMVGLGKKEIEAKVLFQVAKYKTLLTTAQKTVKQAKYALQVVEQLKEQFAEQLEDNQEREHFEMLFDHVFNPGRVSDKTVKRELTKKEKEATKEVNGKVAGVEAATALLKKMGYGSEEMKKLFTQKAQENK